MEQRTSIMMTAILFALVVAGSIAYLIYTAPEREGVPLPTPTVLVTPRPASPTPTSSPAFLPVETSNPVVAAEVSTTAPTGSSEWLMVWLIVISLLSGGALVKLGRA